MGVRDWLLDFQYNPVTDYSGQYGSLFGADKGGNYFYDGPNSNWRHALDDRLKKQGNGFGWYELSASNMDRDEFQKMTERNNILESMYRQGYSMDQLNAHMAGERNVLDEGPAGNGGGLSWDSSVGQAGSAWGPKEDSPRLFSEENEQMRKAIGEHLEKKLFG